MNEVGGWSLICRIQWALMKVGTHCHCDDELKDQERWPYGVHCLKVKYRSSGIASFL